MAVAEEVRPLVERIEAQVRAAASGYLQSAIMPRVSTVVTPVVNSILIRRPLLVCS